MDLRSQLAPSHLHCQPLHWSRSRPSLLARLLHLLPGFHHLLKSLRLADWLLDCSDVSHLRPPPRPPAPLSRLLLSHCGQRTRHTFRTSPGRCSCGQISGQVMDNSNLCNPDFYSSPRLAAIYLASAIMLLAALSFAAANLLRYFSLIRCMCHQDACSADF